MPHLGRCCHCLGLKAATLKRISGTTGETLWTYGPGLLWDAQYGAAFILGLVPNLSDTPDRYVVEGSPGGTASFPDRAVATPSANVFEAFTITKIDNSDGSVNTSATLEGVFGTAIVGESVQLLAANAISRVAALSGGDLCVLGQRYPVIELDDFGSNNTTKEYTFHAHTQQAGDVDFVTKTSADTITLPYNCTAANAKTQIETSGDVSSATVTGGPWPHSKLDVSITWNSSSDDFDTFSVDETYSVSGVNRSTAGVATSYSVSTGLITNSAGFIFGLGSGSSAAWLISQTPLVPTSPDPPTDAFFDMVSGPSNSLAVIARTSGTNYTQGVTVGATWTVNWTKNNNAGVSLRYAHIEGGSLCLPFNPTDFASPSKTRNGAVIAMSTGTVTEIDDGLASSVTSVSWIAEEGSPTLRHLVTRQATFSDADYPNLTFDYYPDGIDVTTDTSQDYRTGLFYGGPVSHADSTYLLGSGDTTPHRADYDPPLKSPAKISGSAAFALNWTFYGQTGPYDSPSQFRFKFNGGSSNPVVYSSWIDWDATSSEIQTAILDAFPENTEGVASNADVNPLGDPAALDNTTGLLDRGLNIIFAGGTVSQSQTWGFILLAYVNKFGSVRIETRNLAQRYGTNGAMVLLNHSDASEQWSRNWGTKNGVAVALPLEMWLKSGDVYGFGPITGGEQFTYHLDDVATVSGGPRDARGYGDSGSGADPGWENDTGATTKKHVALRFENVAIPQGTTLTDAVLSWDGDGLTSGLTANIVIYLDDVDDAGELPTGSTLTEWATFTKTTASATFTIPVHSSGDKITTGDIKAPFNEVFARVGWAAGNDIVILAEVDTGTGSSVWSTGLLSPDTANTPKLVLEYTP